MGWCGLARQLCRAFSTSFVVTVGVGGEVEEKRRWIWVECEVILLIVG